VDRSRPTGGGFVRESWGRDLGVSSGYRVKYVDDALLNGRDWILCNRHGDGVILAIRKGARRDLSDDEMAALLEDAWNGFLDLCRAVPAQRQALDPRSSATAAS